MLLVEVGGWGDGDICGFMDAMVDVIITVLNVCFYVRVIYSIYGFVVLVPGGGGGGRHAFV